MNHRTNCIHVTDSSASLPDGFGFRRCGQSDRPMRLLRLCCCPQDPPKSDLLRITSHPLLLSALPYGSVLPLDGSALPTLRTTQDVHWSIVLPLRSGDVAYHASDPRRVTVFPDRERWIHRPSFSYPRRLAHRIPPQRHPPIYPHPASPSVPVTPNRWLHP